MPYKKNEDLPENVIHVLPSHAQDIYRLHLTMHGKSMPTRQIETKRIPGKKLLIRLHGVQLKSCTGKRGMNG